MRSDLQIQKELLSPPGDTIQETIDTIGMSQAELAERIGRPKEKLNALINGNEPLTLKTAILLERVLGIPASFWIERERGYRLELSKIEQH
jgi:HTH-type transcriptional regulator / antitoxin HigA